MDNNLQHYASPYYDPQKAHEYYMRTRELKGRRSATKLSDEGKKVWSYTKNEIKAEKKAKVEGEQEKRKQTITALRERASATREQISARLKELNDALTKRASRKKEAIDSDKKSDAANSANASAERKQVASRLKSAISAAREAYKAAKESLDSSYEEIYQREFDKIAAEMPKVSKRKRKSSQKKK